MATALPQSRRLDVVVNMRAEGFREGRNMRGLGHRRRVDSEKSTLLNGQEAGRFCHWQAITTKTLF
jgi:hypothetical protein